MRQNELRGGTSPIARQVTGSVVGAVLAVTGALVLSACAPSAGTPSERAPVSTPATTMPPAATATPSTLPTPAVQPPPAVDEGAVPKAKDVYRDLIAPKTYRSWATAPGFSTLRPGTGPHGVRVQVFVNATGSEALARPSLRRWPVGTVIVKDGFVKSGRQIITAYMRKTRKGWYFAEWKADGKLIAGALEERGCAACHEQGDDYVMSFDLP